MARKRNQEVQPEFDDFSGEDLESGKEVGTAALEQPAPVNPSLSAADGKQILARLFGISLDDVHALTRAREEAAVFAMAAQAQEYAQKMASEAEQKHIRDWAGRSSQERTQEVVDRHWPREGAAEVYRVRIVRNPDVDGKPESITLLIPASSPDEAQGRYMRVCGIRSTGHFVRAEPTINVPKKSRSRSERDEEDEDEGGDE